MSNAGFLQFQDDGSAEGEVDTLEIHMKIALSPVMESVGQSRGKRPSHTVLAVKKSGRLREIGAAWRGPTADGKVWYSLVISDPSLGGELRLAAFERGEKGEFDLDWRPPKEEKAA